MLNFIHQSKALFNLNDKRFVAQENSKTGEVGEGTVFHYFQEGEMIWADYTGGSIKKGQIIGKVLTNTTFEIRYQHLNTNGEIKTGFCHTEVTQVVKGKLQLNEAWQWTSGGKGEGTSVLIELAY